MFWQDDKKPAAAANPARASEMWDRDGVLSKGIEDDAENPALNRKRRASASVGGGGGRASPDQPSGGGASAGGAEGDDAPAPGCDFYKKGWFWACVVVVTIICIAAPVGVATQRRIDAEGMNPQALTPTSAKGTYDKWAAGGGAAGGGAGGGALLFDPVSGTFSAAGGNRTVDVSQLTCADLRADLPASSPPEGRPPPPLASAGELEPAALAGATWPGFDDGRSTFLAGLSTGEGWASGDLASAAYSLRAAGAQAVRVPFAFTDLFTLPAREAAHRCGAPAPGAKELADAIDAPPKAAAAAALARPVVTGNAAAFCNAYVPASGATTLARFLYTVQTLVESGHYVILAYAPPAGGGGEAVVEAPESLAASWGRLWAALSCLPGYGDRLAGRVFAEPLATPRSHGIAWGGGGGKGANGTAAAAAAAAATPPLAEYYGAAADAIEARAAKSEVQGPIYVVAGSPAQAASFGGSKPYGARVVAASDLYSGAAAKAAGWQQKTDLPGARPWTADATERAGAGAAAGAKRGAGEEEEQGPEQEPAAGLAEGKPAPGTVAAARAAARQAAEAGAPMIETGRRRLLLF